MATDVTTNTADETERLSIDPTDLRVEVASNRRANSKRLSYTTNPPVVADAYAPE